MNRPFDIHPGGVASWSCDQSDPCLGMFLLSLIISFFYEYSILSCVHCGAVVGYQNT